MLKFLKERKSDYNANLFVNELVEASKYLGILEGKVASYQFDGILIPLLTTRTRFPLCISKVLKLLSAISMRKRLIRSPILIKFALEASNHTRAIIYGSEYLLTNPFSHTLIKKLHQLTLEGIVPLGKEKTLGQYKTEDNRITNSMGSTIFTPPPYTETKKYMDELIYFMNDSSDGLNPLIKAAIMHSQFESIIHLAMEMVEWGAS